MIKARLGATTLVCCCCVLLLATWKPLSFVHVPAKFSPAAAAANGRVALEFTQLSTPDILAPSTIFQQNMAAFLLATICGLILGFFTAMQDAGSVGQGLQGLGMKPLPPTAITDRQRAVIELADAPKALREAQMDAKAIKQGLEAEPKEKRVAAAMQQMRDIADKELNRTDSSPVPLPYNPAFM
eukprot:TRINITY_DN17537_c0_g1_i1.p1 TRINITY_DN17537_c0_g1~~TRINITY_DN17537_c0_g1_i1.p1  ORF type:complete len:184 (+),score=50.22 TRINITY_DN17537_c0_g1_i1:107-658(+)